MEKQKMNVHQKLAKARTMFQNKNVKKTGKNPYAKFSYFELTDILPVANEICEELGLLSVYNFSSDFATLSIYNVDEPEQVILFNVDTNIEDIEARMGQDKQSRGMQPVQRLGSVITYTKRYLYMAFLEISEHDLIDGMKQEQPETQPKKEKDFRDKLVEFVKENNLDVKKVSSKFGLNKESSDNDYQKVLANLSTLNDEALSAYANEV